MKRSACSLLAAFLLLFTAPGCGGGDTSTDAGPPDTSQNTDASADGTPPTAGNSLTASNPTSSTVDLSWSAATDDTTAAASLEYRAYFSLSDNLDTLADVENQGTAAGDWEADVTALTVESLSLDTTYYFNVLVRDEAGNMAVFGGTSEATLDGTWQDAAPLEELTTGSAYYSTLAIAPDGELLAHWSQAPTWETHFATRGPGASEFNGSAPWSDPGIGTATLAYGFDGNLMSASIRRNGAGTADVLFGAAVPDSGTAFEEVATGLVSDYVLGALACVAQNGDAMVVWLHGPTSSSYAVRARFRTGTTWGDTTLVSSAEGLDLNGLEVVCSPNGNHVVLFAESDSVTWSLNARVYDATLDSWTAQVPLSEDTYDFNFDTARTADGRVVVAYGDYDETEMTRYFRARIYNGATWSTSAATLASSDPVAISDLMIAAVGGDVHAIWRTAAPQLVTRRLDAGSTMWGAAAPLETAVTTQEFCLAGGPVGGLVLAWADNGAVDAQLYSPITETWGTSSPLLLTGDGVGRGSLDCIMDTRRRATVVWTEWDPDSGEFSAFERTFR